MIESITIKRPQNNIALHIKNIPLGIFLSRPKFVFCMDAISILIAFANTFAIWSNQIVISIGRASIIIQYAIKTMCITIT